MNCSLQNILLAVECGVKILEFYYTAESVVCDLAAMNEIRSDEYHHTESAALNMTDTILFFAFSATGLLKSC